MIDERREDEGAPEGVPFTGSAAALVTFVWFAAFFVVASVAHGISSALRSGRADSPALDIAIASLGFLVGGVAALAMTRLLVPRHRRREEFASMGWIRPPAKQVIGAIPLAIGVLTVAFAVSLFFPPDPDRTPGVIRSAVTARGWALHIFAFMAVVLAPLIEEFLFRGVLFTGFRRSLGLLPAGALVTALFVLGHLPGPSEWARIITLALAGIATLALRIRTGSLIPPMVFHATINGVAVIGVYASGSGPA